MTTETNQNSETQKRWAILIGISKYKHEPWSLKFADDDAEDLYKTILKPYAGGFEKKNIVKLINEDATADNIRKALRTFLKKPGEEDLVLIYFACHGYPDSARPEIIYLLPYETNPKDVAGTALKMSEIRNDISDYLHAKRVIIIADACHSASLASYKGSRDIGDSSAPLIQYLEMMKKTSGIAYLTSAEPNESAHEDENLGGGHGVFTYYLLKGLNGAADKNKNGEVTVEELFRYVRDEVEKETGELQHPHFDVTPQAKELPMSVPGTLSAEEYFELGRNLYLSGLLLDDEGRFEAAIKQLDKARRLKGRLYKKYPEAYFKEGLAQTALQNFSGATHVFNQIRNMDAGDLKPLAEYYLSIAYAREGEFDDAIQTCESFLEKYPEHDKSSLINEFKKLLSIKATGEKHALLIGIGEYTERAMDLNGPDNDIQLMHELLSEHLDFPSENIMLLQNAAAKYKNILKAIQDLQQKTTDKDIAVVYYSGHAVQGDSEPYILVYDSRARTKDSAQNMIGSEELHNLITKIPAYTTLILDTHSTNQFVNLVEKEKNFTLFLASSPDSVASEQDFNGTYHGLFTYYLVKSIKDSSHSTPQNEIFQETESKIRIHELAEKYHEYSQNPVFISPCMHAPVFVGSGDLRACLELFDFSQRRNYEYITLEYIQSLFENIPDGFWRNFPQLFCSFGHAFLGKHEYPRAIQAFENAIKTSKLDCPETILALGFSQLLNNNYEKASGNFKKFLKKSPSYSNQMKRPIKLVKQLKKGIKHALLVGIDDYISKEISNLRGAVNDVEAMYAILVGKFGFKRENTKILINREATAAAISEAFTKLAENARGETAVFYYAGRGSISKPHTRQYFAKLEPAILSTDAGVPDRKWGIIHFSKLIDIVGDPDLAPSNLFSIIDAGWDEGFEAPWGSLGSRFSSFASEPRPVLTRTAVPFGAQEPPSDYLQIRKKTNEHIQAFKIGRFSIYPVSIQSVFNDQVDFQKKSVDEAEFPSFDGRGEKKVYGAMTYHLVQSLLELFEMNTFTFGVLEKLLDSKLKWLNPYYCGFGTAADKYLFSNVVREEEATARVRDLVVKNRNEPYRQIVQITQKLIEDYGDTSPEIYLERGVAFLAMKDHLKSISEFETAIEKSKKENGVYPEAKYHLGLAHYLRGVDLDQAVTDLRESIPDASEYYKVRAKYYLGQTIKTRIEERQLQALKEAEDAFKAYVGAGAPIGHMKEIFDFLNKRRARARAEVALQEF